MSPPPADLPSAAQVRALHEAFHSPLSAHPDAGRRAGWRDARSQWLRFEVCASALDLDTVGSVLDVGCGLGDFLAFSRRRGFKGDFVGLDLQPSMIEAARARHPDQGASFVVGDLLKLPEGVAGRRFDLVVVCGALSLRIPNYHAYFEASLAALWAVTGGALALVLPSSRAPKRIAAIEQDFVCHDPALLRARVLRLSPYVCVREDFLATDVALYAYRGRSPAHEALEGFVSPLEAAELALERDLPERALALLEHIAEPRCARAWLCVGEALRALGRRAEAKDALGRALALEPELEAARLLMEGL